MHSIFRTKPTVTVRQGCTGRAQLVETGGMLYDVRRTKRNGLHLQETHFPLCSSDGPSESSVQGGSVAKGPSVSGATTSNGTFNQRKVAVKKKLGAILSGSGSSHGKGPSKKNQRGGALAPL